jgi:hypothetical protein
MSQSLLSSAPGPKSSVSITGGSAGGDTTYIAGVHFTVTRVDAETLQFSGLGFDPDPHNISFVADFTSAKLFTSLYTPRTHVFDWDSGTDQLTVTGAAFSSSGSWEIKLLGPDRFSLLPEDVKKVAQTNKHQLAGDSVGIPIAGTPQNFTASWVDLGSEISMLGFNTLKLYLTIDANNSDGMRIRALDKHESGGVEEYTPVIETIGTDEIKVEPGYWELTNNVDQLITLVRRTDCVTPFVQPQMQAGTVGATAGQVDAAYYVRGWQ